jgi:hypothetical protein
LPGLVARFSADRDGIYAGETFQLTLSLLISGETLDRPVSISGLPPADQLRLGPFQELPIENVTLEGRIYENRRFRCRAKAQSAGAIVLMPGLQGTLIQESRSYFFVQRQQRPVAVPVEPLTLIILPLPDTGRPPDFSGAVGRFSFQATAAPLDIAIGDLITVTLKIDGEGLPDPFTPPRVPDTPGLKVYEIKPVPEESSGSQCVFRQTVVPADASVQTIPALAFTFFDARAGHYRTQTSGPFPLTFHAERAPVQPIYSPPPSAVATSPAVSPSVPPTRPASGGLQRLKNRILRRQPAVIRGNREVAIRLAPSDSSKALFTLKPGATVFRESASGAWVRISCREGIGWVAETDLEPGE